MDLSDFEITIEPLDEKVTHANPSTGETEEAVEMKITWKHNTLDVSELNFYLRENHVNWNDKLNMREQEILNIWMEELGYDKQYYKISGKIITENGKIEDDSQVENWLKPNGIQSVEPTDVGEI
jgi:hypothetical protein|tara:strand:+ start:1396 stop:1767 length:372 start_codon:yes stop_codon:yes gene_type:complete